MLLYSGTKNVWKHVKNVISPKVISHFSTPFWVFSILFRKTNMIEQNIPEKYINIHYESFSVRISHKINQNYCIFIKSIFCEITTKPHFTCENTHLGVFTLIYGYVCVFTQFSLHCTVTLALYITFRNGYISMCTTYLKNALN